MIAYLGGKSRIAKELINYMLAERDENMTWVEPFMGSGRVLFNVKGPRIGNDINHELIALFKAVQNRIELPDEVTEEQYNHIKQNPNLYPDYLKGFVSIGCSFGSKRWGGYARDSKKTNYADLTKRNLLKSQHLMKGVNLFSCDYKDLKIPPQSLIYCDPPYLNTTGYGFDFNHDEFYDWCKTRSNQGHLVFISEYQAPFTLVWSKKVFVSLEKTNINYKEEKLFRVHKERPFKLRSY